MRRSLVVAALALFACTRPATEVLVVIETQGIRIPDDVRTLHIKAQDRMPAGDLVAWEQDVPLCYPGGPSNCYALPVTAVLHPGPHNADDTVRVQVDAYGMGGALLISDAATFLFSPQQSLRLDFVLYANCIGNVSCADRDKACGPDDMCVDIKPGLLGGNPDLAAPAGADMATPGMADMTAVDLAGADLWMPPADLTTLVDMAGCVPGQCSGMPNTTCIAGTCEPCGTMGITCCFGPTAPPPQTGASPRPQAPGGAGGTGGGTCLQNNLVCDGTTCVSCGTPPELCCTGSMCFSGMCDGTGHCQVIVPPPPDLAGSPMDMAMPGTGVDSIRTAAIVTSSRSW